MSPNMLPTVNGQFAAVDAPPSPLIAPPQPQGPPATLQTQTQNLPEPGNTGPNMQALMQQLSLQAAPPTPDGPAPGPPPVPPEITAAQGPTPNSYKVQKILEEMQAPQEEKKKVQKYIASMLGPDGLKQYLPNGGKTKASDMLADALYNFGQLNLRNPLYGVLQGQPYKPIQQQRMEQAIQQHTADIQNATLYNKSLDEDITNKQFMYNQARQEEKQNEDLGVKQGQQQLAMQKYLEQIKQNAALNKIKTDLAASSIGLRTAQQTKTEAQTSILNEFGGNTIDFLKLYVKEHHEDPTFLEDYAKLKKTVEPAKAPTGTTVFIPNQEGGYNVQRVDAGSQIPPGARTLASIATDSTFPMTTRTMVANAPAVIKLTDELENLIDKNEKALGPLTGRWNEFVVGKIGLPGEGFTRIAAVSNLLQTKLMQMHVGSRGSVDIMKHFGELMQYAKQSPENLRASLDEIKMYANFVANEKPPNAPTVPTSKPASVAPPPVNTVPKVGETHNGKRVAKTEMIP